MPVVLTCYDRLRKLAEQAEKEEEILEAAKIKVSASRTRLQVIHQSMRELIDGKQNDEDQPEKPVFVAAVVKKRGRPAGQRQVIATPVTPVILNWKWIRSQLLSGPMTSVELTKSMYDETTKQPLVYVSKSKKKDPMSRRMWELIDLAKHDGLVTHTEVEGRSMDDSILELTEKGMLQEEDIDDDDDE